MFGWLLKAGLPKKVAQQVANSLLTEKQSSLLNLVKRNPLKSG
jgi:hypothetical protein